MRFAFVAYAHADQTLALALTADLRQRGIDVWLADDTDLSPRKQLLTGDALGLCSAYIMIESPAASASEWVKYTSEAPHYRCQVVITVKAETIRQNLDKWLDSIDDGINLMPIEFYDHLAEAGLIHRRRGGRLRTPSRTGEANVRIMALVLLGACLLLNGLAVLVAYTPVEVGSAGLGCDIALPRVAMLEQTTTNEFTGITDATISFRGIASDRPVVRLLKSNSSRIRPDGNVVIAKKQADFGDITFTVTDFDPTTALKVEVTCHGFCYYQLMVKEISCDD